MKVRGRVRRVERVEIEKVELLRKHRETAGQPIVRVDDVVDAREGVEALALDVALVFVQRFEAWHVVAHEAILDALKEEELVFLDRAADSDARSGRADAVDFAVPPARTRECAGD